MGNLKIVLLLVFYTSSLVYGVENVVIPSCGQYSKSLWETNKNLGAPTKKKIVHTDICSFHDVSTWRTIVTFTEQTDKDLEMKEAPRLAQVFIDEEVIFMQTLSEEDKKIFKDCSFTKWYISHKDE